MTLRTIIVLLLGVCHFSSRLAAAAGNGDGIVGIGLNRETPDHAEIGQLMPGGPGEKANLAAGDRIVAIDGQAVSSPQQAFQLLHGSVGSIVKITIERNGTRYEASLTRIAPSKPAPQNDPPAPLAANNNIPAASANGLPAFLKTGTRLVYRQGQSVLAVEDVPGKWEEKTHMNSGGVGYFTLDIAHATPEFVAGNGRYYLSTNVANDTCVVNGTLGLKGNGDSLDPYWINPARLAKMETEKESNFKITRQQVNLDGKTYSAISIVDEIPTNYSSKFYDLDTGILLSLSQSVHENQQQNNKAGMRTVDHVRFAGIRSLKIPWINAAAPRWAIKGASFQFQGNYGVNSGMGPLSYPLVIALHIDEGDDGVFVATTNVSKSLGNSLPAQDSTSTQVLGSAVMNSLWIPPEVFQRLQPNQIIDDDPIIKHRTLFQGRQNNSAVFVEQGMTETAQFYYDLNSGMLTGVNKTVQNQVGQDLTQYQLVGQR